MITVRKALAQVTPHVSAKTAWRRVIQMARQQPQRHPLAKRAAIDAMLDSGVSPGMDLGALKRALHGCVHGASEAEKSSAFDAVRAWYTLHVPPVFDGRVPIHVEILGVAHPVRGMDEWLETKDGTAVLDAHTAVRLHHHLDNRPVAGGRLRISLAPPGGHRLPSLTRGQRARQPTRHHHTWLPHTDPEGRFSASPRAIAGLHASLLEGCDVIYDPFCGAGADAIGFALIGKRVLASDTDEHRLELAMRNAHHFGVQGSIDFAHRAAADCIASVDPDRRCGVYLDPPWGGPGSTLDVAAALGLVETIPAPVELVLKVPREFPVAQLPAAGGAWNVHLGLDVDMVDRVERLKTLALHRVPRT